MHHWVTIKTDLPATVLPLPTPAPSPVKIHFIIKGLVEAHMISMCFCDTVSRFGQTVSLPSMIYKKINFYLCTVRFQKIPLLPKI